MFNINNLSIEIIRILAELGCSESSSVALRCLYQTLCDRRSTHEEAMADHDAGVNYCVINGWIKTDLNVPPHVRFTSAGYRRALDLSEAPSL